LEKHAKFLREIVDGGGKISLTAQLPGETNIGDLMGWESLTRLGALKINLGAEVFPNLKKRNGVGIQT
jgi:hypothetical protein